MEHDHSVVIQCSETEDCFVAGLPEWNDDLVERESYEIVLANV